MSVPWETTGVKPTSGVPWEQPSQASPNRAMLDMIPTTEQPQVQPEKPGLLQHLVFSTPVQAVTDIPYAIGQVALSGPDRLGNVPLSTLEAVFPGARAHMREWLQQQVNDREKAYQANPENQNFVGDLNRGIINAVVSGKLIPGMASPTIAGAAGVSMMQPVTGASDDVAKGKIVQGAVGAATAGLLKGVGHVVQNNPLARALGNQSERQAILSEAENLRNATKSTAFPAGAEPSLGQASGNPLISAGENLTEYVPLSGAKKGLETQNAALKAKLDENILRTKSALGTLGAGPEIAASAEAKLAANKVQYGMPFNYVRDLVGDTLPQRSSTIKAFDDAIAQESRLRPVNSPEVQGLIKERQAFASGEIVHDFKDMEAYQDRIQYDAAHNALSQDPAQKAMSRYSNQISHGIGEDMHATVGKVDPTGFSSDIYKQANKDYNANVRELSPDQATGRESWKRESQILNAKEGGQSTIPDKLFKGDNPDLAAYAKRALNPAGHNAVLAEIWNRVGDAASDSKLGFSPAKARTALSDHANFIKEFASPEEQKMITGYMKALGAMDRSGQYAEKLTTGKSLEQFAMIKAPFTAATGLVAGTAGAPAAAASAVGSSSVAKLYTVLSNSPAGKEWLLGLSQAKQGPEMDFMMTKLPKIVSSAMTKQTSQEPK